MGAFMLRRTYWTGLLSARPLRSLPVFMNLRIHLRRIFRAAFINCGGHREFGRWSAPYSGAFICRESKAVRTVWGGSMCRLHAKAPEYGALQTLREGRGRQCFRKFRDV